MFSTISTNNCFRTISKPDGFPSGFLCKKIQVYVMFLFRRKLLGVMRGASLICYFLRIRLNLFFLSMLFVMKDFRRKAFILLLCFTMLALLLVNSPADFTNRVKIVGGTYSFFYDCVVSRSSLRVIENGAGIIVQCGLDELDGAPDGYSGVSVSFDGDIKDAEAWLKRLHVREIYSETIGEGILCVYGYSPLLKGSISVDGREINIQLAVNCGVVHIGSPLLLGSY